MRQLMPLEKKKKGGAMKTNRQLLVLGMFSLSLAIGCNPTKYLTEDEMLYNGGNVIIHKDSIPEKRKEAFEEHLEGMLTPKPNKKFLGMRIKLGLWNMGGGPDSTDSGIKNWLKKKGEKPVLLSDVNREYNENL